MTASVAHFALDLDPPLRTARETLDRRRGLLLQVGENPVGLGESAPLPPFTESFEASERVLERAVGASRTDGWSAAVRIVSETAGGTLRYPAARHALTLASLDRQAKRAGTPLYRFLGGDSGKPVAVNATIGDGPAEATADAAASAADGGYPAIKIKVGAGSVERDLERLRAVRDRIGAEIELRADANGSMSLSQARQFLDGAADLGLSFVEQPLPADQGPEHAQLPGSNARIALDESLANTSIESLLAAESADVYVLKPMAVGGIDVARGLVTKIRRAGAEAVVSSIFESVVGRTAAIHLAASIPDLPPAGLATGARFLTDLAADPAPVREGHIVPPGDPGLGIGEVIDRG